MLVNRLLTVLQKLALARQLGKDPVKEKRLKLAHKKGKKKSKEKSSKDEEWEDDDSDAAPELVDTSMIDDEAEEASEGEIEAESREAKSKPPKGGQDGDDGDGSNEEEEEEEEQEEAEEEEEEEEDVALSDIDSDNDLETPDVIPHQKLTIDNHAALTSLRNRIAIPINKMTFGEHQSLTASEPVEIPDIDDDLNRELAFYKQAFDAAKKGRELLKKEKVPFERPSDYFAEMMKDDEHMGKVKSKLLEEAERKKRSQESRKLRDLKKFGKQVQVAKLQEREKEKKQTLEKIQLLKRSTKPCSMWPWLEYVC
jgi:rRNA-processing protein EBP2